MCLIPIPYTIIDNFDTKLMPVITCHPNSQFRQLEFAISPINNMTSMCATNVLMPMNLNLSSKLIFLGQPRWPRQ